jgi:hypothetical protein
LSPVVVADEDVFVRPFDLEGPVEALEGNEGPVAARLPRRPCLQGLPPGQPERIGGVEVPNRGYAVWELEAGHLEYIRLQISDVQHDYRPDDRIR